MNISLRERIYLIMAAVIVVPLIMYKVALEPINASNRLIEKKVKILIQSDKKINFYNREIQFFRSTSLSNNFQADAAIRQILSDMSLTTGAQINSTPGTEQGKKYTITFSGIRSDQLVTLIYKIENNTPVMKVNKLTVSRSFRNKNKKIKVQIEIVS